MNKKALVLVLVLIIAVYFVLDYKYFHFFFKQISEFFIKLPSQGKIFITGPGPGGSTTAEYNLTVYTDPYMTAIVTLIDWGELSPGQTAYRSVYVQNTGTKSIKLQLGSQNWNPQNAVNYLQLGWDYDNSVLAPSNGKIITFSLYCKPDISNIVIFSFDIVIYLIPA